MIDGGMPRNGTAIATTTVTAGVTKGAAKASAGKTAAAPGVPARAAVIGDPAAAAGRAAWAAKIRVDGYGAERYGEAYRGGRDFGVGSRGDYGRGSDWDYGRRSGRDYGGGGSQRQFGGNDYSRRFYGADQGYGGRQDQDYGQRGERGFWERAGDEVSSWFGDDDAERRRRMDEQRGGIHRGRGPKGYTRSDDRIREDVNDRLSDDPFIDASEVEVSVSSCEVTLSGTVDSREAKRRAEDIAEQVSGVRHVQNNLRVQQQTIGMMGTTGMSGTTTGAAETTTASTGTTSASGKAGTTT
jgi:osmotically-inducible protein OsmY